MADTTPTKTESAPAPTPEVLATLPTQTQETLKEVQEVKADDAEPAAPQPAAAPNATATTTSEVAPTPTAVVKPQETEQKEPVEPQNPLTERFTQDEWTALKEFRKQLPEIFEAAYSEKKDAKTTPITLWGVELNPTNPLNAKTSVVLMKFLRARNLNPRAAHDMLLATLRWRDQFNVEAACEESFPEELFGQIGYIYGKDKEGRPVVYNVYGGHNDIKAVFGDIERFLRWRVAFMEKGLEAVDFETVDQQIQIHDYEGVSMISRDANSKNAASQASSIFSAHYPELLYKKFFVNVPSYLTWIFWLFKPILPTATLAKMSMIGTNTHGIGKALHPYIDDSQLPKRYGGKAEGF